MISASANLASNANSVPNVLVGTVTHLQAPTVRSDLSEGAGLKADTKALQQGAPLFRSLSETETFSRKIKVVLGLRADISNSAKRGSHFLECEEATGGGEGVPLP